jgi:hypothetical protein
MKVQEKDKEKTRLEMRLEEEKNEQKVRNEIIEILKREDYTVHRAKKVLLRIQNELDEISKIV